MARLDPFAPGTKRATVEDVLRRSLFRRLVSIAVATAFVLSSLAAFPTGSGSTCPAPDRSCTQAMFTDGCCHGQSPATATTTTFAEAWSTVSRFHTHQLIAWPAETAGGLLPGVLGSAVDACTLGSSPPPTDRPLTCILLI